MNEKITSTTFASTQKINNIIKKAHNKSSYSIEKKSHSNENHDYDNAKITQDLLKLAKKVEKTIINVKDNATKITNTFEEVINNDIKKKKEISLFLRSRLQRQNVTIKEEEILSIYNNY